MLGRDEMHPFTESNEVDSPRANNNTINWCTHGRLLGHLNRLVRLSHVPRYFNNLSEGFEAWEVRSLLSLGRQLEKLVFPFVILPLRLHLQTVLGYSLLLEEAFRQMAVLLLSCLQLGDLPVEIPHPDRQLLVRRFQHGVLPPVDGYNRLQLHELLF